MANFQEHILRKQAAASLASGNLAQAESTCRQILSRRKNDLTALQVMGVIAFERGQFADAASYLRKCLTQQPKDPMLHCNLAKAWAGQGCLDRAIASFDKALRLDKAHADAVSGKADLLERRGDYDKARNLLAPLVAAGNEVASMAIVFAKLQQRAGRPNDAIALVQRHLDKPDLGSSTRRQLLFVLAKAFETAGQFDRAFEAYTQGNSVDARPFDAHVYAQKIEHLISTFSAQNLATLPRAADRSELPIFVVGMPRTGSTLVERIIDRHPKAHGAGEIAVMAEMVGSLMFELDSYSPYPDCIADLTQEAADRLGRAYLDQLRRTGRGAVRVVDKALRNYENLGLISRLVPGARVIDCRRDPLDTCLSCYMQTLAPRKHPYASDLRNLGLVYRQYERLMRHWQDVLDLPMMTVSYEKLVADQEGVSRAILDFAGLEWDDQCLRFYESQRDVMTLSYDQVRRPIYNTSVGRHHHFEAHLGPLKEALAEGGPQTG